MPEREATGGEDPIRVAIVGTGNIAGIHAAALSGFGTGSAGSAGNAGNAGNVAIVAACDVDGQRLATFCDEHHIPAAYHDIGKLLGQSRPDLVHVCSPPWLHHEHALACLRAGVSVLVEKPPTISLEEFDELTAAENSAAENSTAENSAAENSAAMSNAADGGAAKGAKGAKGSGSYFATVFQHRFGTGQRRLKALAAERDGPLGKPLLAICHTTWFRDQAYFDVEWRGRWDTEGGGPTMGHGIHQMDMLLDVLGDWTEVSAIARRQARRTRTEDISLAHVTFANGAVASIVNSVLSPREESYLRFDFENATVELTHVYGYGDDDWRVTPVPGHEHEVLTTWKHTGSAELAWACGHGGVPSGHAAQLREVLSSLRERRRPPVAPADSRRTLALVTAIYASAFTRRPVTPADIGPGTQFYVQMNGGSFGW